MIGSAHPHEPPVAAPAGKPVNIALGTIAAMGAIFVGLGLARFAFGPLQPAMVIDGWFSGSTSSLLTAANLAGYLFGALAGARLARRFPAVTVIRVMMVLTALSFFACADNSLPFAWFFGWRVVSGVTGGILMALSGPTILAYVAEKRRPLIGETLLYGITVGIIFAGAIMPVLIDDSVSLAWVVLGALALLTTAATWGLWPPSPPAPPLPSGEKPPEGRLLPLQYGLVSIGVVPQMVFLVDYIARDVGLGVTDASHYLLVYGLGSLAGPVLYTFATGKIGLRTTLRAGILVQLTSCVLLLVGESTAFLAAASFLAGLGMPGMVAAFLLRSQQISEGNVDAHRALWGATTAAFAVGQAIAAFGTSYLLDRFGEGGIGYPLLFGAGAVCLAAAFALDFAMRR
ncbi:MAG: YbfB/YjiJ family MFS transporter [Solirubrobacteraceae bacterium]|nr:YbfB/YjiJ family MFS transporter [Solirubrobacteraceae bacterium]